MPGLIFGSYKRNTSNKKAAFNFDHNGHLKVVNYDYFDLTYLRSKGYCYNAIVKTIHNRNTEFSLAVINNPVNSGYKIYLYDITMDVINDRKTSACNFYIKMVNNITNPQSIEYNSLLIGETKNDYTIFNKWDTLDINDSPIYQRIEHINTTGLTQYNYNFLDDMFEIPEGRAIVLRAQHYKNFAMTGANSVLSNIKFIKVPSNEVL